MVQSHVLAETNPRSNFLESRIGFLRHTSLSKLNTDEAFQWLVQNILVQQLDQPRSETTYLSSTCPNLVLILQLILVIQIRRGRSMGRGKGWVVSGSGKEVQNLIDEPARLIEKSKSNTFINNI